MRLKNAFKVFSLVICLFAITACDPVFWVIFPDKCADCFNNNDSQQVCVDGGINANTRLTAAKKNYTDQGYTCKDR